MPMVRIELFKGRTREQKARAAKEVTEALARTIGSKPEATQIIFADIEKADWADNGKLCDES
jgi:4-oxalocrotonate tautomerase